MDIKKVIKSCFSPGKSGEERSGKEKIVEDFHRLYYATGERTWQSTRWLGTAVQKCPFDLWVYQEIIVEKRPGLIIETGTLFGGSALFLATVFDLVGEGEVVTVDIEERPGRPRHARITYLTGSSVDTRILKQVQKLAADKQRIMVILDSDHSRAHVAAELEAYAGLVSPGSYLIVEDTNLNGHPVFAKHGPGPHEAVEEFLARHPEFTADREKEKFFLTFNPKGFLKKKS